MFSFGIFLKSRQGQDVVVQYTWDNEGRISDILRLYPINAGYILFTADLVTLKRGNSEPILMVRINEWRKLIDYFSISIVADPSRMSKNNMHFVHFGYIPSTSYGNPYIARQNMDKEFNL